MRKIAKKILFVLLAVLLVIPSLAFAADANSLDFEQCEATLPNIGVFFYPLDSDGNVVENFETTVTATNVMLDTEKMTCTPVKKYQDGTLYILLVDISRSISKTEFDEVKAALAEFVQVRNEKDRLMLLTFGESVNTLLYGKENVEEVIAAIDGLSLTDKNTAFFEAIVKAADMAKNTDKTIPDRKVVVVISDGKDASVAGSSTKDESLSALSDAGVPLYALGVGDNKEYLNALGEYARGSGGELFLVGNEKPADVMKKMSAKINAVYYVGIDKGDNIIEKTEKLLTIKITSGSKELSMQIPLTLNKWEADEIAPTINQLQYDKENGKFIVYFSENVEGVDAAGAVKITDPTEKEIGVKSVSYNANTFIAEIQLEKAFTQSGRYDIAFSGIRDISMEKNELKSTVPFDFEIGMGSAAIVQTTDGGSPMTLIIVFGVVIVGAIALVIVASSKKKKNNGDGTQDGTGGSMGGGYVEQDEDDDVNASDGVSISINISGAQGNTNMMAAINGVFIVGRDKNCNLPINDPQLSRRHFQISESEGELFITDLGSSNGTTVNGVQINAMRKINSGDMICAGNNRFMFSVIR